MERMKSPIEEINVTLMDREKVQLKNRAELITKTNKGGKNEKNLWAQLDKYTVLAVLERKELEYKKIHKITNIANIKSGKEQTMMDEYLTGEKE